MNRTKLTNDLTDAFIKYQYRLENPFPSPDETKAVMTARYASDPVFRSKVMSLVGGVLRIIDTHDEPKKFCYKCDVETLWLAPDGRCGDCTGYTPEEIRGEV